MYLTVIALLLASLVGLEPTAAFASKAVLRRTCQGRDHLVDLDEGPAHTGPLFFQNGILSFISADSSGRGAVIGVPSRCTQSMIGSSGFGF